jgi:hypothetical protein
MQGAAVVAACPGETGSSIPCHSLGWEVDSIAEVLVTLHADEDLRSSTVQEARGDVEDHFSPKRQLHILEGFMKGCTTAVPAPEHVLFKG